MGPARGLAHLRAGRAAAQGRALGDADALALVPAAFAILLGRRTSQALSPDAPALRFALAAGPGALLSIAVWANRSRRALGPARPASPLLEPMRCRSPLAEVRRPRL